MSCEERYIVQDYQTTFSTKSHEGHNFCFPMSRQQGYDRTLARIQQRFPWYAMTQEIRNFVTFCQECNCNKKTTRKDRCRMKQFHAGLHMEIVHFDF